MNTSWWKESVIYQIYPRSFQDSNGDGIGDIPGIIRRLDYIKSLGVDIIWLCPVYASPNDDNGYDISDYYGINPEFGTMADFDLLLDEVHNKGMKLIMDLVVNHSSDEHVWFQEARKDISNPKRDFYTWKKGQHGHPPNNWQSFFGGSAWEYNPATDDCYLHLFTKKQPDLNWENPNLRKEIYKMMRFWLDKGIDGFRMDVISLISKKGFDDTQHAEFTDTIAFDYANGPRVHEFLQEMNREVLRHYNIMTVGEGPGITLEHGLNYVQDRRKELSMIFHFDHMFLDHGAGGKFDPAPIDKVRFKKIFREWDETLKMGGWSSIFLGNHDFPRIVSRFGNDQHYWEKSAKALAVLLLSLRGTPYIYQGDEIGMTNVSFSTFDDYRDIETKNVYRETLQNGGNLDALLKAVNTQGRDNARTPVQWDADLNAGFTVGSPWIKLNPGYATINVAKQENDPASILNFYRKMIAVRKQYSTLVYGEYEVIQEEHPAVFGYWRYDLENTFCVLINLSDQVQPFELELSAFNVLINNYPDAPEKVGNSWQLMPWQATLLKV